MICLRCAAGNGLLLVQKTLGIEVIACLQSPCLSIESGTRTLPHVSDRF